MAIPFEDLPLPEVVSLIKEGGRFTFQNSNGKPLYTYDQDQRNVSKCDDQCVAIWEPLVARDGATPMGDWTLLRGREGKMQWAYKGSPIYSNREENSDGKKPDLSRDTHWHILVPDTTAH